MYIAPDGTAMRARIFFKTVPSVVFIAGIALGLAISDLSTSLSISYLNAFSLTSKVTR